MRSVQGLLLAVGVVLQLLLGGSLVFSATGEADTGGLSDVSADLVTAEQLTQMKSTEDPHRGRRMALGAALAALALLQLVATVLAFKGRGRKLVLGATGLSVVGTGLVMVIHEPMMLASICAGVLVVALIAGLLATRPKPEITT